MFRSKNENPFVFRIILIFDRKIKLIAINRSKSFRFPGHVWRNDEEFVSRATQLYPENILLPTNIIKISEAESLRKAKFYKQRILTVQSFN